jgi:hypothetical protein
MALNSAQPVQRLFRNRQCICLDCSRRFAMHEASLRSRGKQQPFARSPSSAGHAKSSRELKIIAAIVERAVIGKILIHLGLDPQPPPRGLARETG